jgi:SAM-dependent methyltransferase
MNILEIAKNNSIESKLSCPICGNTELHFLFKTTDILLNCSNEVFNLYQCHNCLTVSTLPMLSSNEMDRYYRSYYTKLSSIETPLFLRNDWKARLFSKPLANFLNINPQIKFIERHHKPGRLLEIGCGSGNFLYAMKQRGWNSEGLEMSAEAVSFCREKLGLNVRQGNLEETNFQSATFDVIYLAHVFEHLANPHQSLDRFRNWLSPNGILVLTVPNAHSWIIKLFGRYWHGYDVPRHYFVFSTKSLSVLASQHGFDVESCQTIYGSHAGLYSNFVCLNQLHPEKWWVRLAVKIFRHPLVALALIPFFYIIDRLNIGEAITIVLKPKH